MAFNGGYSRLWCLWSAGAHEKSLMYGGRWRRGRGERNSGRRSALTPKKEEVDVGRKGVDVVGDAEQERGVRAPAD